jgi:hypothetical protein
MPNLNFAEALSFFDKALSENYSVGSKPGTSFQTQPKLPEQILLYNIASENHSFFAENYCQLRLYKMRL